MKTIYEILKSKREKAGLTQLEVSKRLGLSSGQFVSLMERGQSKVPMETLGQLFVIFSVKPLERKKIFEMILRTYQVECFAEIVSGELKQKSMLKFAGSAEGGLHDDERYYED